MKSRDRGIDDLVPALGTLRRDPQPFVCAGTVGTRRQQQPFSPGAIGKEDIMKKYLLPQR
jgi:hypothetical protein